ncbi:hypothetical protein [Pseudomonas abietaniphila]|uniref:hypothetical protein n=1 Tax=Pseudomonas abietaniphila TaxID=89065 RepID=UPI000941E68F|nr:hypothetical protein [Pseudomonas abietaniphila]
MNNDLTEEEMRRALFGPSPAPTAQPVTPTIEIQVQDAPPQKQQPSKPKSSKPPAGKIRVTLRVGNVYEGATEVFVHDASTLSSLLAEQEATKLARKKFRYVEVVSVKPSS